MQFSLDQDLNCVNISMTVEEAGRLRSLMDSVQLSNKFSFNMSKYWANYAEKIDNGLYNVGVDE